MSYHLRHVGQNNLTYKVTLVYKIDNLFIERKGKEIYRNKLILQLVINTIKEQKLL